MARRNQGVAVICVGVLLAVAAGVVRGYYVRTVPRLSSEGQTAYWKWVKANAGHEISGRSALAAVREFILAYPRIHDPQRRLIMATAVAEQSEPDDAFVADVVERVALDILSETNPKRLKDLKAFVPMGFDPDQVATFANQDFRSWSKSMILADVDGDGTLDLLLRYPVWEGSNGCCLLFRHTSHGWVGHRIAVGAQVYGMWIFDITPHGPRAIETACLVGEEYDPTFLVNVYVWRDNRLTTVLSTTLQHGFQFDHTDLDGDGRQAIRLYGGSQRRSYRDAPITMRIYRWDGSRYRLSQVRQLAAPKKASDWESVGDTQFDRQRYADAEHAYMAALAWKPAHGATQNEDYRFDKNLTLWNLGICLAMRRDGKGAAAAMRQVAKSNYGADFATPASKFIGAIGQGQSPRQALAASGQIFRTLESEVRTARPGATPEAIFAAAGVHTARQQRLDLSGDGVISCLAQISWPDGNAVVALRPNGADGHQQLHILAYGRTDIRQPDRSSSNQSPFFRPSSSSYWLPLYLPRAPALQIYPAPTAVELTGGSPGDGRRAPEITLDYVQDGARHEGIVRWNGEQFVAVSPAPSRSENFEAELNRIEDQVFIKRSFQSGLAMLAQAEDRVRISDLNPESKLDLLLEIYYHDAICYRMLGQRQRAAVTYDALQRSYSNTGWGKLAQHQLEAAPEPKQR